jgi:hypothetical protein
MTSVQPAGKPPRSAVHKESFFDNPVGSRFGGAGGATRAEAAYTRETGTKTGPQHQRAAMSDKSPRQTMTKKSGKSLKEKRAAKRTKASEISQTEALLHTKKH